MNDVTCVRCNASVPASQTDFCADGMVCRKCIVITTISDKDVARLEGELARSTARKRIITGLIMLTFGITILALGLSRGGLVLIPTGMLLGGFVELGRGLTGLSSG